MSRWAARTGRIPCRGEAGAASLGRNRDIAIAPSIHTIVEDSSFLSLGSRRAVLDKVGGDMVRPAPNLRPPKKTEPLDNNFEAFDRSRTSPRDNCSRSRRNAEPSSAAQAMSRRRLIRRLTLLSQLVVVDNASDQPTRDLLAAEAARRGAAFHANSLGREHRRRRRLSRRNARLPCLFPAPTCG